MAFVKCHHFFLGAWSLKTRVRCWEYTFTNILKEFVQALITSEKKNKACTTPEFIKSAYTFVMQVRILLEKYYGEC